MDLFRIDGEFAYELLCVLLYDCTVPQELIEKVLKNAQVIVDGEHRLVAYRGDEAHSRGHKCYETGGWKILDVDRMRQPVFQKVVVEIIEDQYGMMRN